MLDICPTDALGNEWIATDEGFDKLSPRCTGLGAEPVEAHCRDDLKSPVATYTTSTRHFNHD